MGITGLIPFLEKASKRGNISQFAGGTVAIDSYCWLHKGAFSCADKIALGQPTDAYVKYCMKFVHMLLANRIKPILVFDGRHLPAKKETEVKRRENRESTRRRAAELMRMGQTAEGRNLLRRSVDITHEIALDVIRKCQEENVDCIVAPYEADAQLAYLNISGIADVIITEDSDLTLFGCKKIFFKMDSDGNGLLVEQERLHLAMNVRSEHFNMDKFRHMCILSGCDYLPSLPGIGLSKACKFICRNTEEDIHKALPRLGSYLNMKALVVTSEYRDAFIRALITFKHQLVYCPLQRKQVRLSPPGPEITEEQLHFAGDEISEDVAYQMALGNYDPFTKQQLHNFDPDRSQKHRGKTNSWHDKKPASEYVSIWSKDYKVPEEKENEKTSGIMKWPNTTGRVITLNTDAIKTKTTTPRKRNFTVMAEELSEDEIFRLYGTSKLKKNDEEEEEGQKTPPPQSKSTLQAFSDNEASGSPVSPRNINPFAATGKDLQVSPSLVCRGKRRIKLKNFVGFRPTVIDEKNVETSKYFSPEAGKSDSVEKKRNVDSKNDENSTSGRKIETDEDYIIDSSDTIDDRETNFIEETQSQEKLSTSSGVSSSESASEENLVRDLITTNKNEPSVEMEFICKNELLGEKNNLLDLQRIVETEHNNEHHTEDGSREYSFEAGIGRKSSSQNSNESLRCNLFKWANSKDSQKLSIKNVQAKSKSHTPAKTKTIRKTPSQGKIVPAPDRQQSLLHMFGFQKKPVLTHSMATAVEANSMET